MCLYDLTQNEEWKYIKNEVVIKCYSIVHMWMHIPYSARTHIFSWRKPKSLRPFLEKQLGIIMGWIGSFAVVLQKNGQWLNSFHYIKDISGFGLITTSFYLLIKAKSIYWDCGAHRVFWFSADLFILQRNVYKYSVLCIAFFRCWLCTLFSNCFKCVNLP